MHGFDLNEPERTLAEGNSIKTDGGYDTGGTLCPSCTRLTGGSSDESTDESGP